jgi:hypothetical protein
MRKGGEPRVKPGVWRPEMWALTYRFYGFHSIDVLYLNTGTECHKLLVFLPNICLYICLLFKRQECGNLVLFPVNLLLLHTVIPTTFIQIMS